jgi:hypothetical protein
LEAEDSDGLHLNADGYKRINDQVISLIKTLGEGRYSTQQPVSQMTGSKTATSAASAAKIKLPK